MYRNLHQGSVSKGWVCRSKTMDIFKGFSTYCSLVLQEGGALSHSPNEQASARFLATSIRFVASVWEAFLLCAIPSQHCHLVFFLCGFSGRESPCTLRHSYIPPKTFSALRLFLSLLGGDVDSPHLTSLTIPVLHSAYNLSPLQSFHWHSRLV